MLFELGKELRKIHDLDQKPLKDSGLFPCDDPSDLVERLQKRYQSAIQKKKENINPEKLEVALREVEKELEKISDTGEFVTLHANPYIPHVFVDETKHKYSGIIDFGDSYIGHPIIDMWYWRVSSRQKLLLGYTHEKQVSTAFRKIYDTLNVIAKRIEALD